MNLIPDQIPATGNYWCTWRSQATACGNPGLKQIKRTRTADALNEEFLFGEIGALIHHIDPAIRGDLIVVLDDGWDIPYDLKPSWQNGGNDDLHAYGSLILDSERFPSFTGTPVERLQKLSDKVKSLGYQGLGLWIAPQVAGPGQPDPSAAEAEAYWIERLDWCRQAGIRYWKVDWGKRAHDPAYRAMLYRNARLHAPQLKIEQAFTQSPFDIRASQQCTPEYEKRLAAISFYLSHGDYFRVYDASPQFRYTTTIARTAEALLACRDHFRDCLSVLNIEDPVYIGAALGMSLGIMRLYGIESDPAYHYHSPLETPMTEVSRALHWQRIAPPFAVMDTHYQVSPRLLQDAYQYPVQPGNPWPNMSGRLVVQDCPAAISRNMPLPEVRADFDEPPFVLCSIHPLTKALAVYAAPRTIGGSVCNKIPADITVQGGSILNPIGIFGEYRTLTIDLADKAEGRQIWAQDLCAAEAVDITGRVGLKGNRVVLDGDLIHEIGLTVQTCASEMPGLILQAI